MSGERGPDVARGALARAEALAAGDPNWHEVTQWPARNGHPRTPCRICGEVDTPRYVTHLCQVCDELLYGTKEAP